MEKILTKDKLLEQTFNYLKYSKDFEIYTFEEKKQYLKCLREVKLEIKQLEDIIINNNLDTFILIEQPNLKIKDHISLIKQYINKQNINNNSIQILNNIYHNILNEDKFFNKKWVYIKIYLDFEIYFNDSPPVSHLTKRIIERSIYSSADECEFITLIEFIIDELIYNKEKEYLNIEKQKYKLVNNYYIKQWNVKLLDSELFPAGMIQIENDKIRFYVSTNLDFDTMKPKKNSIYFELDI